MTRALLHACNLINVVACGALEKLSSMMPVKRVMRFPFFFIHHHSVHRIRAPTEGGFLLVRARIAIGEYCRREYRPDELVGCGQGNATMSIFKRKNRNLVYEQARL